MVTNPGSSEEAQLRWLFGIEEQFDFSFNTVQIKGNNDHKLDFTTRLILEETGIEFEDPKSSEIDEVIRPFQDTFPSSAKFSGHTRLVLPDVCARDDPDAAIMRWLNHETRMFKRLEQRIIEKQLEQGFMDE